MSNIYIQEPPTNGKVLLKTTVGDIDIELWSKEAPKACRNFVQLCMEGYYDNTIFHRIVKGFCIQGGDPTGTGTGGESIYGHPFKDEFHQRLRFVRRGLVAMANAGSNDNSSQFFFTLGRADELNGKHTIFGKVTGDTVYNMIKMEDCDVDQDDRPLYPPKINTTEVLSNPFDDIEPRELVKKKTKQGDEKLKKAKTKGTKNFSLLSFGEEAEEDEQEVLTTSKTLKIKSSHDVLDDPRLSAEPALQSALDQTEDDYDEKMRERVKEKLRKQKQIEKNEELREPDKEDRGKALKEESKRLAKEIREAKRRKIEEDDDEKQSDQNKGENHKVSDTVAEFREERESYLAKKKSQRKGGSRENDTLDLLAGFQSKLDAVGDEGDESEGDLENEEDDSGWMQHALRFETRSNKVKDANIQDEDTFEIFDPRNPINKRRREASKESRERKKGSRR